MGNKKWAYIGTSFDSKVNFLAHFEHDYELIEKYFHKTTCVRVLHEQNATYHMHKFASGSAETRLTKDNFSIQYDRIHS